MNQSSSDILIIGGGVVGLSTALRLAEQGVSATVIDRQEVGREASWAGAGMLPPGCLQFAETPEARLRAYSYGMWKELSESLFELTGIDNGYRVCGAVELFDGESSFLKQLDMWTQEGIRIEASEGRSVNSQFSEVIEKRIPGLSEQFNHAVFLPDFAQARNPRHLKALVAACRVRGVEIVEHVEDLTLSVTPSGNITASTSDRQFPADRVCVTAGSWTNRILEPLGCSVPVNPVRGQIVQLQVDTLPFRCVIELGRRYLVPRPDGLILIGSTEEHVGFVKQNTAEGVSGLLKFAEALVPELAEAEVVRTWSGLRPGTPDELPFLGAVPGFENLFVGAGHFRSGLQMSPGTSRILADLLTDRQPDISLDGLTFDRINTVC